MLTQYSPYAWSVACIDTSVLTYGAMEFDAARRDVT